NGSIETCIDVLAETPGGAHLVTVLGPSDEAFKRNANVKVDHTLGYTFSNEPFVFAKSIKYEAMPEHARVLREYFHDRLPELLEGWQEGKGSKYFRPQKLIVLDGGLEKVDEAMRMLMAGKTSGEKIIVKM
ncbi:unnamed protein product, partial [Tilletia laevis]